ncbi:MAG: DUF167 domain-containing protein [Candidatus Odinarchaeum yellowstonii]|uniref:DUF167 domain-containing protein n=1 Tax=Odinarchaeota yellowstonii (strain LCB_4) TaxID=1841599 RepID=A0AAF0D191_ODILC|nr:MAG: DUF167 domain-containing protein [Candidatus Odinarchaeum yellowstonii]
MIYEVEVKFKGDSIIIKGNRIEAHLNSKPERGEANRELIKKLAKFFNTSTSNIKIIKGLKSKYKIVEVIEEK